MKNISILFQPIRCIMFIIIFLVGAIILKTNVSNLSKWWSVIAVFINILTMILLLYICKKNNINYSELIGYKKKATQTKSVVIVSLIILIVGIGGMYLAGYLCYGKFPYMAVMMIHPIPVSLAILNVFMLPITTTLAEDGLYLGLGVNQISNKWLAIFFPAFFYALQHSFIPVMWDLNYVTYRFLSFLPLTILMCYLYHKKRNPIPFMIGHFIINLATVAQILVTSISPEIFELMKNM